MLKDLIAVLRGELSLAKLELERHSANHYYNRSNEIEAQLNEAVHSRNELLASMSLAMGRLVAKLDPTYNVDEMDPDRRKASDAIGKSVMNRLLAESAAQRKMMGES